jgi:hypothetical protein
MTKKLSVFLLCLSACTALCAQSLAPLQTLYDHFVGTWAGINHDYMDGPTSTSRVTIRVTLDKGKDRLKMDYFYAWDTTMKVEHDKVLVKIDPNHSSFFRDRKGIGKQSFQIEGLDDLLHDGYGSFSLHGVSLDSNRKDAVYRADYHLTPDTFSYEVFTSTAGAPFVKTGDWSMTRQTSPVLAP